MSAAEKLARLNAKNVRFDIGSGGIPDLTPQDIAAGLAFVPPGLGREVLIAVGWPDGARPQEVMRIAAEMACAELNRQFEAATLAGIRHAIAIWEGGGRRRQVEVPQESSIRTIWPRNTAERLPAIVAACLSEIVNPHACHACHGRGTRVRLGLVVDCPACGGRGTVSVSDRKRAEMIGIDEATYRRNGWGQPYGWVLSQMLDAYHAASRRLHAALRA